MVKDSYNYEARQAAYRKVIERPEWVKYHKYWCNLHNLRPERDAILARHKGLRMYSRLQTSYTRVTMKLLVKALQAPAYPSGVYIMPESLEATMKLVTFDDKQLKLWPKVKV